MVNSLTSSDPTGSTSVNNHFGNLATDPSPMESTSAPSSFHAGRKDSSIALSSSSTLTGSSHRTDQLGSKPMEDSQASGSGSDSQADSCSECEDENCDCDASWVEISALDVPSIDGSQITEKIDNMLTSLSKIDQQTSVGPSLNPGLIDLEQQLVQLREDNVRLLSVLEATNDAMKKNLKYAQELKGELNSSQDEYDSLKSSADSAINQLRAENERLRQRVSELENEVENKNEPVAYHQFDIPKEMSMQEMSSQIASRDLRISKLTGEINRLTAELERARYDLSQSSGQQRSNSNQHSLQSYQSQHQQMMTHSGDQHQLSAPAMNSASDQYVRSNVNDSNNQSYTSVTDSEQNIRMEMNNLRLLIEKLRQEKQSLEEKISGRRSSRSSRHAHVKSTMGTSYTANARIDNQEQFGEQSSNNTMENDDNDNSHPHHHHGRHRRHHRHHASRTLRRLEKKLAKTSLPVINSAIMFKGFTTYSNQP